MKENEALHYIRYSEALAERFHSGVLEELQDYDHFVTYIKTPDNKKIPFDPNTHTYARTDDASTWGSLEQSLKALRTGRYTGIGFVFSEQDPYSGVDLDNCMVNGERTPEANAIVSDLWSYTELSPSKTGLHVIVEGTIPHGIRKNNVEIYSTGRYFTITTNQPKGMPETIEYRQAELDKLYTSLSSVKSQEKDFTTSLREIFVRDDYEVIEKAKNAKNGQKFSQLWQGDYSSFRSKSEADFTLCLYLLYWCSDNISQAEILFKQSGLYDEKSDRKTGGMTYLQYTIQNALKKRHR